MKAEGEHTEVEELLKDAPDNAVKLGSAPTKLEKKTNKKREEKKRQLLKQGVPENQIEGVLSRWEYENLPIDQKMTRIEGLVASGFNQIGKDMMALEHNDRQFSDAFDINHRAMSKMFEKLGLSKEDQAEFLQQSHAEVAEEHKQILERGIEEAKQKADSAEKKTIEDGANTKASEGSDIPEGATVFT